MSKTERSKQINPELEQMQRELDRLRTENNELRRRLGMSVAETPVDYHVRLKEPTLHDPQLPLLTAESSTPEKITLFRHLFKGREDVYAIFWTNERSGKKGYSPALEDPWAYKKAGPKKFLPLTDHVIHDHLAGEKIIGSYPLLKDNSCWFLACDFDKDGWVLDSLAFLDVATQFGVPAYLERSRSGKGGHVWVFFSSPVPAISARQLGMRLLRETMDVRADIDLASYDRFFPNQDFVPAGGFGNLIALPLQKKSRGAGNTEFINLEDPELHPYPDQWSFLSRIERVSLTRLDALLEKIPPVAVGPGAAIAASPVVRQKYPAPRQIRSTIGAMISMEKSGIPPWMLSQIKHLASIHNPKFYERQKLRLSTFQIPRFIRCYEEDIYNIHLPRGIWEAIRDVVKDAGSRLSIVDQRPTHKNLCLQFQGFLTAPQELAVENLLPYEIGVLVAPPGAGKTVMGCFVVAKRNLPTLILAHRKPILEQWRMRLMEFLNLSSHEIGQIGGGRSRRSGIVDLAMIQSMRSITDLEIFFGGYGFIIVDECHHLPAFTFEACFRKAPVRYVLGLTATPYRSDGLESIITMQCGPIRYKLEDRRTDLFRRLNIRETSFSFPADEHSSIQEIFRSLVSDEERNGLIAEDVIQALNKGRQCLVLTQWKEHCHLLAERLIQRGRAPFVLSGELGKKERASILASIDNSSPEKELLVIATGQYLGEGFDCPRIDTLFLAFPVSFKGKIVQYVGRTLRTHQDKSSVMVYDYFDFKTAILSKMHFRRLKTYKTLGFKVEKDH